jgi:imidazolonepropionase-like amidohydrolase
MTASQPAIVIRHVTVIDGTGRTPQPGQCVLVEGRRIAGIVPDANAPTGERLTEIDGTGHAILPGLIDCHVHLCNDGAVSMIRQVREDTVPIATLRAVQNLGMTLRAGVTTVRDCGAADGIVVALAGALRDGLMTGPRVLAAGRVITMTGGHCHFIGREADGPDAVRRATRAELKDGADFIKVIATGGVLTPGVETDHGGLQHDELVWVTREAHNAGRRTAAHAIGAAGIKNALRAGVDSIEHGFHLDDEALELAVNQETLLVPTLAAVEGISANLGHEDMPAWIARKSGAEAGSHRRAFAAALTAGVRIAAGTDAGTPFNPHGAVPREMALMVEYGMTPMQAIIAATSAAARNLGLDQEVGTVETGKLADLILTVGDPAQDIEAIRHVDLVIRDGLIRHDALQAVPAASQARP